MTNKQQSKQGKGWSSTRKPSHNIDSRIVDVVRFLARRSAEQDYERHLRCTTSLTQKPDLES
ncbi:hypothetical protein [Nitrosomonas ureae]|uniref:hypothetical protein n=1 Tax=Nitrosomonas ureae TaxID=44577 RepID=UPI0011AB8C4C|nr:hypothetical protein [Nitrosomonas ureae]